MLNVFTSKTSCLCSGTERFKSALRDTCSILRFRGVHFLFFYIPRVDRSLRPVYCGLDPYTGTYRRDLDGDSYHVYGISIG
jgi:hypothetical protein